MVVTVASISALLFYSFQPERYGHDGAPPLTNLMSALIEDIRTCSTLFQAIIAWSEGRGNTHMVIADFYKTSRSTQVMILSEN